MAFLKVAVVVLVLQVASYVQEAQATKGLTVRFSPNTYEVTEGIGKVYIYLVLDGKKPKGDIKVTYKLVDVEAKVNEDYKAGGGTLTFTPESGEKKLKIPIEIIDDTKHEDTETFKAVITEVKAVDSNDVVSIGGPSEAVITILDNEKKAAA